MQLTALPGLPPVAPGDDLAAPIGEARARAELRLASRDLRVGGQTTDSKPADR